MITAILFLVIAALIEYVVVLYSMRLGVQDASVLQWSFQFPGTSWPVTITISPMFHLVPVCVIITLTFSWTYLTRKASSKRQEIRKGQVETFHRQKIEKRGLMSRISRSTKNFSRKIKSWLSRAKGISYLSQKIRFSTPTVRSALIVLLVFAVFILMFSLLAYPQLIYRIVADAYQANPSLRSFVTSVNDWARAVAESLGPIGWISTNINNALLTAAPTIGNMGLGLGGLITPFATLDDPAKYLLFQNAAAWISVFVVFIWGERMGKGYRYKK